MKKGNADVKGSLKMHKKHMHNKIKDNTYGQCQIG